MIIHKNVPQPPSAEQAAMVLGVVPAGRYLSEAAIAARVPAIPFGTVQQVLRDAARDGVLFHERSERSGRGARYARPTPGLRAKRERIEQRRAARRAVEHAATLAARAAELLLRETLGAGASLDVGSGSLVLDSTTAAKLLHAAGHTSAANAITQYAFALEAEENQP